MRSFSFVCSLFRLAKICLEEIPCRRSWTRIILFLIRVLAQLQGTITNYRSRSIMAASWLDSDVLTMPSAAYGSFSSCLIFFSIFSRRVH